MSTEHARNQAVALWNILVASGLASSPQVAVEQIACLILIKYLEHRRLDRSWTALLKNGDPAPYLSGIAFPRLRHFDVFQDGAEKKRLDLNGLFSDAYFQLEATKPEALVSLLKAVDRLFNFVEKRPLAARSAGKVFDDLLSLAAVGGNSLSSTPPRLSRFMVSLLDPRPGARLIDPAVGTARLLVDAELYMNNRDTASHRLPVGIDTDNSLARIGWMSLLLHNLGPAQLHTGNSVSRMLDGLAVKGLLGSGHYDYVLCDLPLGNVGDDALPAQAGYLPPAAFGEKNKLTRRLELLFIWRALDLLKVKGRAALVVPQGVLHGTTPAQRRLRHELLVRHVIEGVILLPPGTLPQVSTPVALLVFQKAQDSENASDPDTRIEPLTSSVWFYDAGEEKNDLYDAIVHFRQRNKRLKSDVYYQPLDNTKQPGHDYVVKDLVVLSTNDLDGSVPGPRFMQFFPTRAHATKQWRVPVREWLSKPDWQDLTGQIKGSHDEAQRVRPEYTAEMAHRLYVDGVLQEGFLAPHCIEANQWSLDLNDYRWPEAPRVPQGTSTLALIDELRAIEHDILGRLDDLRSLLEAGR